MKKRRIDSGSPAYYRLCNELGDLKGEGFNVATADAIRELIREEMRRSRMEPDAFRLRVLEALAGATDEEKLLAKIFCDQNWKPTNEHQEPPSAEPQTATPGAERDASRLEVREQAPDEDRAHGFDSEQAASGLAEMNAQHPPRWIGARPEGWR